MSRKLDELAWEERLSYINKIETLSQLYEQYGVTMEEEEAFKQSANQRQVGGSHYKDMGVEPWTVMQAVMTHEEFVGFLKGNIIKYGMRQGRKDSDDASKCQHYVQKLNEVMSGKR